MRVIKGAKGKRGANGTQFMGETELTGVFQDINKEIFVDATGFRDIYKDLGVVGVSALGGAVYDQEGASELVNGCTQVDRIQRLADASGISFREAASSGAGRSLLESAVGSFFKHEQGVVAESVYQKTYAQFGGLTGGRSARSGRPRQLR